MGTKISALTAAGTLTGAELVPVVQSGADVQTTTAAIAALAGGSLTSASNFAASDVSIATGGTWADAASVSLAAGTWFIHAFTTVSIGSNTSSYVVVKLYNSTDGTDYASGQVTPAGGTSPHVSNIAVSYLVTLAGTKTIKLAGNATSGGVGSLLASSPNNGTAVTNATGITAIKIA